MATFNIKDKKIIYFDAPKCGSSTVLGYINMITHPELREKVQHMIAQGIDSGTAYRNCCQENMELYSRKSIVSKTIIHLDNIPKDAIKFCVVRDPIERFISVYKALVFYDSYIESKDKSVDNFLKIIDLDKEKLENWKQTRENGWRMVNFHFKTQTNFYGRNPNIFTHIFSISKMNEVKSLLENTYNIALPDIALNKTSKIQINLTDDNIQWVKERYANDYKFYEKWM